MRTSPEGLECRAVQLTVDHNLASANIRQQFIQEHADMVDAVTEKNGKYRVKGKVMVSGVLLYCYCTAVLLLAILQHGWR